jgi:hypothetical protein
MAVFSTKGQMPYQKSRSPVRHDRYAFDHVGSNAVSSPSSSGAAIAVDELNH